MITINRKNPTEGEVTSSLSNAEDGGLHFDGAAGNIDIASPPDLGTKFSFELIIKCDEFGVLQQNFIDFGTNGRFVIASNSSMSWNLGIYDATSWKSFGVKVLDDLKVHHLVVTIDDTAAVLYDNGNQVATVTISANHAIDTCTDARIGSAFNGSGDFVSGTISRTRFYNRVLSGSEIKEKFENQNLKFSDIYGSQTKVIDSDFNGSLDGWNTYNDWNTQTNNSNAMQLGASAATQVCRNSVSLVGGKKYRVEYTASALTGAPTFNCYDSGTYTAKHTITAGSNSFEMNWPVGQSVDFLYIRAESTTAAVTLDDIFVYQIGCVSSYELQAASPTQSLMVQDSSGAADGTCSASGITQIQPLTQLNSKAISVSSSTARTPSDGAIVADKAGIGVGSPISPLTVDGADGIYVRHTEHPGIAFDDTNIADGSTPITYISGDGGALVLGRANRNSGTGRRTASSESISISSSGQVDVASGNAHISSATQGSLGFGNIATNTYAKVEYDDTNGNFNINNTRAYPLRFLTNDTERMTIDSTGKLTVNLSDAGTYLNVGSGNHRQLRFTSYDTTSANAGHTIDASSANGEIKLATGGTARLTISSAGTVKVTSAEVNDNFIIESTSTNDATAPDVVLYRNSTTPAANDMIGVLRFRGRNSTPADTEYAAITAKIIDPSGGSEDGQLGFWTTGSGSITERMTINSAGLATFAGDLEIGDVSTTGASVGFKSLATSSSSGPNTQTSADNTGTRGHYLFYNPNGEVGSIKTNGSATSFNTSSDYRLKENLTPLTGALDRIEQLPVYRFNFKSDTETTVDGFVAHEAQAIVPESVTGEKDAMKTVVVQEAVEAVEYQAEIEAVEYQAATYYEESDELPEGVEVGDIKTEEIQAVEGQPEIEAVEAKEEMTEEQPDMQSIDQSKLVPLLVAAVKELKTEIDALKNA